MTDRFEAFVAGVTACYRSVQRIKTAEMTELGLRGSHAMCLYFLLGAPQGLTAAQLSRLCCEDKAAISRTLAQLELLGYAAPRPGSRYRAPVSLTPLGMEKASGVQSIVEAWVAAGGAGLTEEERAVFYKALSRIAANLEKPQSGPAAR